MKRLFLLSSKTRMAFMIACSSIMLLASCGKKTEYEPEPVGELDIKAVNTVFGGPNQDFLVNGAVKVTGLAYGDASAYVKITSGVSTLGFYDSGNTTKMNAGGSIQLSIGNKVSVWYFKTQSGELAAIPYNDAVTIPTVGKAKVRFINFNNMSSSSNSISVAVVGGSGTLVPAIAFTEGSAFFEVDPGAKFNFTGTGGVAGPAFDGALAANKIYTIWIDGTSATNLTGHIVANN
ncbi:MAG: DUF4397 domain-containing protein [Candidatus Pedobacter colombiensis]|uniref:DUF4397 domain-containing protein n=1 Tax=Candidatus Pedobacter colombiensis TaxID=3121371 RepID=A0AAJ5W8C3_9SPHI|nr:DUF4397 domain-containing protein [Pedobacter sp.]WEK18357.1 MAG: DUF4397 domain-containing protein [Pedobacter sp.]